MYTFKNQPFTGLLFSLIIAIGLFSCGGDKNEASLSSVPQLIDRSEKIQLGKEWDFVQNFYAEQQESLRKNPNDNEAKLNLAQLYIKEARVTGEHGHYYPAALQMIDQILDSKIENQDLKFRSLVTKAGVQLSLHEFQDALKTGQAALVLNPRNAQVYGVLVDCYVELGKYEKAVASADKMVSIKPDLRSYARVSYLREIHGDVEGAFEAMKLAVKAGYPGYEETAWTKQTLAELSMRYGHLDQAKHIFENILETRENYPFAVAGLAEVLYEKGAIKAAEEKFNEAAGIIPEVGFFISLAQIYKDQDRTEEFNKTIEEVLVMLKDDTDHGHNMNLEYADLYLNLMEDPEKAFEYANAEFEKRPENIDVNKMMAEIHLSMNKKDAAKKFSQVAMSTNSKNPDLLKLDSSINAELNI